MSPGIARGPWEEEANLSCSRPRAWVWPGDSCTSPHPGFPSPPKACLTRPRVKHTELRVEVLTLTQPPPSRCPSLETWLSSPWHGSPGSHPELSGGCWLGLWWREARAGKAPLQPQLLSHNLAACRDSPCASAVQTGKGDPGGNGGH